MFNSKKWLSGMIASIFAVGLAVPALAGGTIKIGDINSYKRLPAHTIPYKMGVELALEHINSAGGVLGKNFNSFRGMTTVSRAMP